MLLLSLTFPERILSRIPEHWLWVSLCPYPCVWDVVTVFFSSSSILVVLCRRGSSPPGVSVILNHPTLNQSVGKPFHKKGKGTEPKSLLASPNKKPKNLTKQITHKLPRSVQQSKEKGGKVSIFHSASSSYPFFLCCLLCWGETRHNLERAGGSVLCILIACK